MIEDFYSRDPYSMDKKEKNEQLTKELKELTEFHKRNCPEYSNLLHGLKYEPDEVKNASDIPFFPVRLFKQMDLLSIPRNQIFKTMTSSGTTGQAVSKIFVDKETAMIQQKVLLKILGDHIGHKRIPIMVIDTPSVMKDRKTFTARGAAIIGLQLAAREMTFVLNEDMSLNQESFDNFIKKYGGDRFLIFGFTFMVWQYLYEYSVKHDFHFDLSKGYLMTGGGWKKLQNSSVSQEEFQRRITTQFGIKRFLDHYAMVEQTGCIYLECEYHHLHASIYSDVFIRDPKTFRLCGIGEEGILQIVSVLPHSYPGHSLLTEDRGMIMGEDDCPCGRKGKYIKILGRIKEAEMRGCSDTYVSNN